MVALLCVGCKPNSRPRTTTKDTGNSNLRDQLSSLQKQQIDAINQADTSLLKAILHSDFQQVKSDGHIENRSTYLQQCMLNKNSKNLNEKHSIRSTIFSFYAEDQIAIARGKYIIERNRNNGVIILNSYFLDIYVHEEDQWRLLSSQHTRIGRIK